MDIGNLTINQIKEIAALAGSLAGTSASSDENFTPHIGKICIIRTYASGVFMARVVKQNGRMVELADCRRLWSWKASESISLSAVAVNGVAGSSNKFPPATQEHTVLDALEIIPASAKCIESVNAVKVAVQS